MRNTQIKKEMKKLLLLLLPLGQSIFGHGPHGIHETEDHNHHSNISHLEHYSGDFTDTDNDGMTDVAEIKYGYDPNTSSSFPTDDFIVNDLEQVEEVSAIDSYEFANLVVVKTDNGIQLRWDEPNGDYSWSKYSMTLYAGEKQLYYGGHGWDHADVSYSAFELNGNEVLVGSLSETNQNNGEFVRDYPSFQIDLSNYPIQPTIYGLETNEIRFKFTNFTTEQKEKYVDFMRRVIPILNDVLGVPSESFTCEFIMQDEGANSWITMNHGREIYLDSNWNPRLLVHEMVHMWEGKLGFSWSGENREYSDDLSAFAEVAEGTAYKVLHDYVMAYPNHYVSHDTAKGGSWNNWSSDAWSYDLYKHQKFTGGGTYWTGDLRAVNHRYSLSAMLIQIILVENPDFIKNMRSDLFDIVNADDHILSRDEIINLWASNAETINGIDTKLYLDAMPVFNGRKLDQGFYPVVNIRSESDVDVFSSYSVDGMFWWNYIVPDDSSDVEVYGSTPISSLNLPEWVKYNYNPNDGYYYLDTNDMPYTLSVQDVYGQEIKSFDLRSDNTYQDEERIIPNTLGEVRVSDNNDVAPNKFTQGLYKYNVTYTDIIQYTDQASEEFYFMGEQDIYQNENEILIMIGVDSMFTEKINVTGENFSLDLEVINGCGILKTSDIPLNKEMMLTITISSHDEQHTYKRALVHAGNSWGQYRQQLLIIDRDFDGIEDLYDNDLSESNISTKYTSYYNKYYGDTDDGNTDDGNTDSGDNYDDDWLDIILTDWDSAELVGSGWRFLDWFGYFYQSEINHKWVYHANLGWLYIPGSSFESIWMYSEKYGWIWTTNNYFPFVFIRDSGWVYFNFEQNLYYDFTQQKYIDLK